MDSPGALRTRRRNLFRIPRARVGGLRQTRQRQPQPLSIVTHLPKNTSEYALQKSRSRAQELFFSRSFSHLFADSKTTYPHVPLAWRPAFRTTAWYI